MKSLTIIFLLVFASIAQADNFRSYVEYKNEMRFVNGQHLPRDAHHLRFGLVYSNFYGELGGVDTDFGSGVSGEFGYKFRFDQQWEIKGKWEGTSLSNDLGHKLETEFRFYFN